MKTHHRLLKFGGITLIGSGLLFLAQYLFLRPVPAPRWRILHYYHG